MAKREPDMTGEAGADTGRGVQAIEAGGRLLTAMVEAGRPGMLRDIASAAGMTPAQAHAYLRSFRKLDLVEQDGDTGRYRLGPFALQLGMARIRSYDPLRMAGNAAVDLAAELGLMVAILVWGTHGPTVIQVQEGADQVHVNVRAGNVFSITGTASGSVFATYLPEKVIAERVRGELREGSHTQRIGAPTSHEALAAEIAKVRARGYATIESRPIPGVNALSAPVFDWTGQLQLVITLIGPDGALPITEGSEQAAVLLSYSQRLSTQLGYVQRDEAITTMAPADKLASRKKRVG